MTLICGSSPGNAGHRQQRLASEYVHSRQAYETTQETRWTVEGWATYYAAVLTLEQNRIGFDEFREQLAVGGRPVYSDVTLTTGQAGRATRTTVKGALVAGRADVHIRSATGRNRHSEVNQSLNGSVPGHESQFLTEVEAAGGETAEHDRRD